MEYQIVIDGPVEIDSSERIEVPDLSSPGKRERFAALMNRRLCEKRDEGKRFWYVMGAMLSVVHEHNLWREIKSSETGHAYQSWKDYTTDELGIKVTTANNWVYRFRDLKAVGINPADVSQIPGDRASVIAEIVEARGGSMPKEQVTELIEKAKTPGRGERAKEWQEVAQEHKKTLGLEDFVALRIAGTRTQVEFVRDCLAAGAVLLEYDKNDVPAGGFSDIACLERALAEFIQTKAGSAALVVATTRREARAKKR